MTRQGTTSVREPYDKTADLQTVKVETDGSVAWITLNRPDRMNTITLKLWDEVATAVRHVAADGDIRCVVLTGAGDRAFCAGRDLDEAAALMGDKPSGDFLRRAHLSLVPPLLRMDKPVIAAINGVTAGAGLAFALCADVRVASDTARFTVAFLKVGLAPDGAVAYLLERAVGYSTAAQLCFSSEIIDAHEALRVGLVNRVLPAAQLQSGVSALAGQMAAMPARAVTATKEMLLSSRGSSLEDFIDLEARLQEAILRTPDFDTGVAAFRGSRGDR